MNEELLIEKLAAIIPVMIARVIRRKIELVIETKENHEQKLD